MQGFFLSNMKEEGREEEFKKVRKILKEYKDIPKIPGFQLRMFYNNQHLSYYATDRDFIANNGVFIYEDNLNKVAVKKFYEDLNSGSRLVDLLLKAHGQFFLVLYFKGRLMVVTDRFRTIPVYMLKKGDIIEISNIYYLLTHNGAVSYSVNFDYLAQHLSYNYYTNNYIFTGGTLFNEISYLKPGCIYDFKADKIESEIYYNIKQDIEFGKYKNYKQIIDDLIAILESNYKFLDNVEKIFCGLTGGFDTRLNLSVLLKKNKQFFCGNEIMKSNISLWKGGYSDLEIAKKIAKEFDLNYKNICDDTTSVMKWIEENDESITVLRSLIMSPSRFYYYSTVSEISDIELNGYAGTELLTKAFCSYYRKKKRFDIKEFARTQKYNDILLEELYSKDRYYKTFEDYIAELTDNLAYSTRGDLYTYINYIAVFMNNLNDYSGQINTICPAYSPYLEPAVIKMLMEIPYSLKGFHKIQRYLYEEIMDEKLRNIDTSHGYPATTIKLSNAGRFLRLLNPIEPNLQYFGLIDRIKMVYNNYLIRGWFPYICMQLKFLGLHEILGIPIKAFTNIIEENNPINKYIDNNKIRKRFLEPSGISVIRGNTILMANIKNFAEREKMHF